MQRLSAASTHRRIRRRDVLVEIERIIKRRLIDERQKKGLPAEPCSIARRADTLGPRGGKRPKDFVIVVERDTDLLQVISARGQPGGFAGFLDRGGSHRQRGEGDACHDE